MEGTEEVKAPKLFHLICYAASTALRYLLDKIVRGAGANDIYGFVSNFQQEFKRLKVHIEIDHLQHPDRLDVSALCTLILGFFDCEARAELSDDEIQAVKDIREVRNKIAHIGSAGHENKHFLKLWNKVFYGIKLINRSLDENQEQEIDEKIDRATSGTDLCISLESIQQRDELIEIHKDMIKVCGELEKQYADEIIAQIAERAKLVKRFSEKAQKMKRMLEKQTKGSSFGEMLPQKATLGVKLVIHTESKEGTATISKMLTSLFERIKLHKPDTGTLDDLAKEVKIIVDNIQGQHGVSSVREETGSVKLAIDMLSPVGLLDLLEYLEGGEAEDVLQNISTALNETFEQSATITAELDDSSVTAITETLETSVAVEDPQLYLPVNDECLKHPGYRYTGYCEDDTELVCDQCRTTDHTKCKITDLPEKCATLDERAFEESIQDTEDLEDRLEAIEQKINTSFKAFKDEEKCEDKYLDSMKKDFEVKLKLEQRKMKAAHLQRRIKSNRSLLDQTLMKQNVERQKHILQKSDVRAKFIQVQKYKKEMEDVKKDAKRIGENVDALERTIETVEQYKETTHINDLPERIKHLNAKLTSLKTVSLHLEPDIDLPGSWITGCIIHADRSLVLCDRLGSQLILLSLDDPSNHFDLKLESTPYGIARMNEMNADIVLVTMPEKKKYLKVRIDNSQHTMSIVGSVYTDEKGYGIAACGDKIFICCRDDSNHGHVEVRERDSGQLLETLGKGLLSWPKDVKLSKDEQRLYLCDSETGFLSCLSLDGWLIFKSAVDGIPSGLAVDNEDTVLVCQTTKHQVSAIYRDDVSRKTLPTRDDGIVNPASVAYQKETLVIGMKGGCKVYTARI